MPEDLAHRSPEEDEVSPARDYVIVVADALISRAERQLEGCAACLPSPDTRFETVMRSCVGEPTPHRVLARPARCPSCGSVLNEDTPVSWIFTAPGWFPPVNCPPD